MIILLNLIYITSLIWWSRHNIWVQIRFRLLQPIWMGTTCLSGGGIQTGTVHISNCPPVFSASQIDFASTIHFYLPIRKCQYPHISEVLSWTFFFIFPSKGFKLLGRLYQINILLFFQNNAVAWLIANVKIPYRHQWESNLKPFCWKQGVLPAALTCFHFFFFL